MSRAALMMRFRVSAAFDPGGRPGPRVDVTDIPKACHIGWQQTSFTVGCLVATHWDVVPATARVSRVASISPGEMPASGQYLAVFRAADMKAVDRGSEVSSTCPTCSARPPHQRLRA